MDQPGKPSLKLVRGGDSKRGSNATSAELSRVFSSAREQLVRVLILQLRSRVEAEDVAQETYLRLASKAENLRNQNFRSLLFVTARNLALDLRRHTARMRGLIDAYDQEMDRVQQIPSSDPSPDRTLIAREHVQIVRHILNELPPKSSRAFIAYKFEEQDYSSIASELGVSESMVRKHVIRAMAHCVRRFSELEGWE